METRVLGKTGIELSVIGPGTWQTYDVRDPAEVQPELGFLTDYGLTTGTQALLNRGVRDPRVTVGIPATGDVRHAVDNCAVGAAHRFDAAARDRVAALAVRR